MDYPSRRTGHDKRAPPIAPFRGTRLSGPLRTEIKSITLFGDQSLFDLVDLSDSSFDNYDFYDENENLVPYHFNIVRQYDHLVNIVTETFYVQRIAQILPTLLKGAVATIFMAVTIVSESSVRAAV